MSSHSDQNSRSYIRIVEPGVANETIRSIRSNSSSQSDEEQDPPLEPRFKYDRMKGEAADRLFKKELFSAIDLHDRFVAIGTQSGKIYVMDHQGITDYRNIPILSPHRCAVTKLKFDPTGSYIISCANDGKLVISGIGSEKLCCTVNVSVIPKSIAIAPDFTKKDSLHSFIMGERSLMMYNKNMFQYKSTPIYKGSERDGFINCCSWEGNFIAFTNDSGTQIYDKLSGESITNVQPSHDIDKVRSSRAPPRHAWLPDGKSLIIGWADTVTIIKIVTTPEGKRGEIHNIWTIPMFVCGVSYIVDSMSDIVDIFVVGLQLEAYDDFDDGASLTSVTTLTAMDQSIFCSMKTSVLRPLGLRDYDLQSEDTIRNVKLPGKSLPCSVSSVGIPSLNTYYIMTLRDIIMAIPYGPEDGVRWRLKYKLWDEALDMARSNIDCLAHTDVDVKKVGEQVINGFLNSDRPKAAAARLPLVCGESKTDWEWAVTLFERARICTLLADVVPTSNPQLEPESYESVLQAALFNDEKLFKKLVQTWSPDLYRTAYIINRTQWRIQEICKQENSVENVATEKVLMEALAHLYLYERKYDSALKIYISCRDFQVFNVIDKYQLFDMVKDQISDLIMINENRALRLLLDNEDCVPAAFVMDKIAKEPKLQLAYLTKLMNRNEGAEFADKAVQLYAQHDREKLLPYLRKNEHYHLNYALKVCQKHEYIEEMIFLLAKGGNHYDAVNLMVKKYEDIDKVIEYCREQDDRDLWLHLVDVVSDKPAHLAKLLFEASNCLNPLIIIEKMPLNTDIPGLRNSMRKVLTDFSGHLQLQNGCYDSILGDSKVLTNRFLENAWKGVYVHNVIKCALCGSILISQSLDKPMGYRVFGCGHVVHLSCSDEIEHRYMNSASGELKECTACIEKPAE